MIEAIIEWVKQYLSESALILAFIAIIFNLGVLAWSAIQYVIARKAEMYQKRFENYHEIINWLVYGRGQEGIRLDSQIACVYELRNYETYKEVSIRILQGLEKTWSENGRAEANKRLLEEIKITLKNLGE